MQVEVTCWLLEMNDPRQLRPARPSGTETTVARCEVVLPAFGRFLYETVGRPHHWSTRQAWGDDEWRTQLERPEVELWVAYARGAPAGYFELAASADAVEIDVFGLLPPFIGQGMGGPLLVHAVEQAWQLPGRLGQDPASRVWLDSTSMDHPHALPNYRARGFRVVREERVTKTVPPT
jgi:GNAT superfamily N-acetyltransferase